MKPTKSVWYEPHPCSKERKQALNKKGYTVVDSIFAPGGKPSKEEPQAPREKK